MVLEIFNDDSVNLIFKYKLEYRFEYKLERFNTWELFPDITDYKLEFMTRKFKNLDEIQHTEIFATFEWSQGSVVVLSTMQKESWSQIYA